MPSQEMAMALGVTAYRQLLRKMRTAGNAAAPPEDAALALQQAKQRVMMRLARGPRDGVHRDPRRAFRRLRDQVARLREAKENIKELGSERAAQLRSAYDSLRLRNPRAAAAGGQRELEVLGHDGIFRMLVLGSVAGLSRLFMRGLSNTSIDGEGILTAAQLRPEGQPLITVSNHVAAMDDPLLLAALTPLRKAFQPGGMRWSLCATDRCFKNDFMATFFRAGQVLPVERGKGMEQKGMRAAAQRLDAGDWVHIFPEGTRSADGSSMGQIRAGVGRLVAGCASPPLVVPIVHTGMQNVMPRGAKLPVPGQEIRILVGEPIGVQDILIKASTEQWPETQLYRAIAQRISDSMTSLKAQLEGLPQAPAAVIDELQMLPLIEDEMDAASHPWTPSLRQLASIPSLSTLVQQAVRSTAASPQQQPDMLAIGSDGVAQLAAMSPVDTAEQQLRGKFGGGSGVGSGRLWASLADDAAAYAQQRMQYVAAMLMPAARGPLGPAAAIA